MTALESDFVYLQWYSQTFAAARKKLVHLKHDLCPSQLQHDSACVADWLNWSELMLDVMLLQYQMLVEPASFGQFRVVVRTPSQTLQQKAISAHRRQLVTLVRSPKQ